MKSRYSDLYLYIALALLFVGLIVGFYFLIYWCIKTLLGSFFPDIENIGTIAFCITVLAVIAFGGFRVSINK